MDDEERQVRLLLSRAADIAGPFEAPPMQRLTGRRRRLRARPVAAVSAVAAAVVAVVVGLSAAGALHGGRPQATSLPGPSGPQVPVSALQKYRWSALPTAPIPARDEAASAWTGRALIVWGGQLPDNQLRSDGASYDPATRTWTKLPAGPLTARAGALSVWVHGSFVVWGGMSRHRLSDGARYDVRTGRWTTLPRVPVSAYTWAQLVAVDDKAVLLSADEKHPGIIHADAYDPGSNTWRAMRDLNTSRTHRVFNGTALGVGNSVFLWSDWFGADGSGVDTYALNVRTGTWSPTSLKPEEGRNVEQPIWTGRQFLLSGEQIYCGPCSTPSGAQQPGVAVDPRTGHRTRLPIGPLGGAVTDYYWTGSALLAVDISTEIIGSNHDLYPGDTAAWNPDTNTWTTLASTRLRVGVGGITVWTGTRLLAWGATGGQQFAPARS